MQSAPHGLCSRQTAVAPKTWDRDSAEQGAARSRSERADAGAEQVACFRQTETHTLRTGPSDMRREPNVPGWICASRARALRNGRDARMLKETLCKPVGRGARPAGDPRVLPLTRPEGSNGVVLVRSLQGVAPNLEVEKPNSELVQEQATSGRARHQQAMTAVCS